MAKEEKARLEKSKKDFECCVVSSNMALSLNKFNGAYENEKTKIAFEWFAMADMVFT